MARPGPAIGLLWGAFPWDEPVRKVGKLYSMGAVGRTVTRALERCGRVIPYARAPEGAPAEAQRAALASFMQQIDVLWADVYPGSGPALELRQSLGLRCPAVLFAAGAMPKAAEAMLFPWQHLLRRGDGLWLSCEADRAIWHRLVRWSALHEWVVPLAVDDTRFRPRPAAERQAARRAFGLPATAPLLLAVGRLNIQKNLHSLLYLLAAVRRRVPETHLCFAGEEDDVVLGEFGVRNTGYVAWLRSLAAELGVAEAITFPGPVFGEELARLYATADVAVSATVYHRENFGLAQAEAQACGVPVVCTAWGGLQDVVRHGETGFLMEAVLTRHGIRVDWATGAEQVCALLQDEGRRTRMGRRAAAWARRRFGLHALEDGFAAIVADLTAGAGTGTAPAGRAGQWPAYEPSPFARRYEAHKRACGWYEPSGGAPPAGHPGYPGMFQGHDYALYEQMMAPYATRLARDLEAGSIGLDWVPYFPAAVRLDPRRRLAVDEDPIWPHRSYCHPMTWAVIRHVDGARSVGAIAGAVAAETPALQLPAVKDRLRALHLEGFILFRTPHPCAPRRTTRRLDVS